jgi:hypothetical protein
MFCVGSRCGRKAKNNTRRVNNRSHKRNRAASPDKRVRNERAASAAAAKHANNVKNAENREANKKRVEGHAATARAVNAHKRSVNLGFLRRGQAVNSNALQEQGHSLRPEGRGGSRKNQTRRK